MDAVLSIGALSRACGVPVETLRTWEQRYGFPTPERKPSGHRVYSLSSVARLKHIISALAAGHRAAEVVGKSEAELARLLGEPPQATTDGAIAFDLDETLKLIRRYDADRFTRVLLAELAATNPIDFVGTRIAPLVEAVGAAWERGELDIRHEHFFSERTGDLLRSMRMRLEERATGPVVVMGSLPGELHELGLQMAAVVLAAAGCRIYFIGSDTPGREITEVALELNARAVALSVSSASAGSPMNRAIGRLRKMLPKKIDLLVGGSGAPESLAGVKTMRTLAEAQQWSNEHRS